MQSSSQARGLCSCVGLPLAPHSIPVVEGILAVGDIPVAADDTLVAQHTLAVVEDIPVALGILVVEGILEAASAALKILGVAAQVGLPV